MHTSDHLGRDIIYPARHCDGLQSLRDARFRGGDHGGKKCRNAEAQELLTQLAHGLWRQSA